MDWVGRATSVFLYIVFLLVSNSNVYAEQRVVCYYTNWSVYRPGTAKFSPQNINPYLCTHLIYAFGGFTKDNTLKPFDKYQDIEKGGYAKFTGLKTYNKKLKTMLAIGGWNEGSTRFSPLVADPERREELVKNTIKFLRQNHFDGLDLDWEYPAFRDGGKPRDRDNYADFVQELRDEFERESSKTGRPRLLLSMAIPAGIEYLEKGYDLPRLNEYLDFFNLLSYDYHSAFEPAVNHHSPLYGLEEDNEYNYDSELTIDYTISYLLNHEVTPNKLVLGIPTYGRSYTLFNDEATEIGAPADGPGEEGDATREKGYLAYYEICENIAKSDEWEVVQPNPKAMGPYAVRGNQWVGYDDEEIVRIKAQYVNEKGLGGIMFWSIDNDDFRGKCHDRPYPLIEAAKEAMLAGNNRKSRPSQKPKLISNRKKTRLQSDNHRSEDDLTRRRLRTETNKRHPSSTTPSTRKRISSLRTNSRSNGKSRVNVEENDEEHIENVETEGYSVKSRNKSRPRNRTNKIASRRKAQSTKSNDDNDDDLDDAVEYKEKSSTTPEPPTTPDPGSDFKCQDEGFFPHPRDCKKYFWCLDSGPSGLGIVANQFTCPSGLVFNKIADSCDYPRNVICPKTKTSSPVSTTKAPITTTRATFQHRTTKRTTTTAAPNSDEEYEYDDDESHDVEDEEDNEEDEVINKNSVRSTTAKPLIYKTITRNRSTASTTTTTTEIPTTVVSRNFKSNTHKVLDLEDEEDPRVIKELIDLIKKAGGLEHLEKQLNLQEKYSPVKTNDTKDEEHITPATISRSLYERVLNRQATRIGGLFGSSTTRTTPKNDVTEKITINSRVNYQNGPGGAQFEGLDDVPEVRSLRRTNKPQYVTIERPKPLSIQPSFSDEEMDDDELPQRDGIEQDNADVASSEEQTISNPDNENDDENDDINDTSTKKATPSYVNIRRTRPSTSANENDLGDKDELSGNTTPTIRSNEAIENQEEKESTPKSRYTNTQRFRSTTANSAEDKSKSNTEDSSTISNDPLIPSNIQEIRTNPEKITISPSFSSSTIQSTTKLTTESVNKSSSFPILTMTARSAINASQTSINFDPIVTIIENFVTEIPETTLSISTTPKITLTSTSKTTTTVSQPRPFGFPRRGRPTTTTSSTTTSSSPTTEQNRVKVSNIPTRNFVRLRARTRATTESTTVKAHNHHDDDKIADDELNREKVVNRPNTIARRRGSSRYTKAAHRSTVNETSSNFISSRSTEPTVVVTTDSVSKRRRGRPTTETIEQPITESNKRRRRPISRSSTDPLTDSPIIRISPRNFNAEPIVKSERGGFKNNSINSQEEITNIKVIRISNHIDDNDNDSLNAVEATSLINTDWKTSTIIPDGTTIDYTESTTEITSEDEIVSTPNAINSVFNSDFNSSTETTTIPTQIISTKAHEPVRRKVLLRRRLLVPTSTTESTDEQTTFRPNRRRKVIRRLGPVSPNSIDDITNAPEISTTEIPIQSTIFEENFDVTTEDTMVETIDVDYTNSILATEPTTNDADTIFTNDATEQNTQSINNDIELEESTTMGYSQINYSPETDTIISTSVSSTTIDDKPISRFIRKKFIRKRPADLTSTTPSSTTSTRRLGSSRFSTSSQSVNSGSNNLRRKNVFIRKRPVYPAATTQQSIDETLEENSNSRNRNFINLPNNTAVSREINEFWKKFITTSTSPLILSSNHQGNIVIDDSSPQESSDKIGDIISNRQLKTYDREIGETQKIFKLPVSNKDKFSSGGSNTFWQRQISKTRSYPRPLIISTESSVTETLIPSKKFDFIADAVLRRSQSSKTTAKSSSNDDYLLKNEQTSTTPQIKPQVTRLVTSVVESGTTERQIIRIKTKYSSLTSTTKFPVDSSMNINGQRKVLLDKNNIFADESRHVLLNEIHPLTEKTPEKSTLPIESEFLRRGRYFTTESSAQSSTIAIESVELKYFKELPTLKELIDNNSVINRNIAESSSIKYSKGIHIPVRILNDLQNDEIKDDQFAILQLPEDTVNSTIQRNILTIQLINHSNYENNTETKINFENVTEVNLINHTTEDFTSVTNYETPSTQHIIRGFYVTKSLDESQPKPSTTYEPEDVTKNTISENIPTDSSESTDFTTDDNYSEEYTTNEYLEDTSTLSPITITNESNNSSELINEIEDFEDETRNYSTTDSTSSILITTLPTISLSFSPPPPPKERRPVKEIVVHRRPTTRQLTQSKRRRLIAVHRNKIAANTDEVPRPGNWSTRIIRKRPITESINDQNIAESQPQQSVTLIKSPAILHDVFNTSRIEDVNATVEINLFRSPGTLLRKPGNIARSDLRDRFKSSLRNPTVGNVRVSETQYSNKTSADTYDQSSRAQELLPVSIADPPTITSTIEAGNETPTRIRGIQRHKIEVTYDVYTEPPTIVRTTIEPFRRRQRPAQNEDKINIDVTSPRSRRPAIIDYDYYVDEEVRLSIKPELKNKIYITRTGGIRCLDQGSFAHPTSCKKFITCAPMVGGQVIATEYTCPAKLSFDPVGGICNWSAGLGCKEPSDS
ncbi:hypothetical protein PV327_007739 [Microctonus hyperodae]|uniref:chitinase n=1 Tax=Microctonus hyperodae TaxID=165561 RepID=A0AA39KYT0_MICHY|nr:hypothetical protein PV327_007739 [Microctonus hyperodae]